MNPELSRGVWCQCSASGRPSVPCVCGPATRAAGARRQAYFVSLDRHDYKPTHHFSLPVEITGGAQFANPVRGVLTFFEQGVDLSPVQLVFRLVQPDGSLSAPVTVNRNAEWRSVPASELYK